MRRVECYSRHRSKSLGQFAQPQSRGVGAERRMVPHGVFDTKILFENKLEGREILDDVNPEVQKSSVPQLLLERLEVS